MPKNGVEHRTGPHTKIKECSEQIPDDGFNFVEGHHSTSFSTKKKNARVVITVLATADQIMSLCDNVSIDLP